MGSASDAAISAASRIASLVSASPFERGSPPFARETAPAPRLPNQFAPHALRRVLFVGDKHNGDTGDGEIFRADRMFK